MDNNIYKKQFISVNKNYDIERIAYSNGYPEISVFNMKTMINIANSYDKQRNFEEIICKYHYEIIKNDMLLKKAILSLDRLNLSLKNNLHNQEKNDFYKIKKFISNNSNVQILKNKINKIKKEQINLLNIYSNYLKLLKLDYRKLQYCDNRNKEKYKVYIKNGKFYSNGQVLDSLSIYKNMFKESPEKEEHIIIDLFGENNTSVGKVYFSCTVIDKNNDLYVFPFKNGVIHHNFISRNNDVLFAGMALFKNGKISYLSNYSGHYETLMQAVETVLFPKFMEMYDNDLSNLFTDEFDINNIDVDKYKMSYVIKNNISGIGLLTHNNNPNESKLKPDERKNISSLLRKRIAEKFFTNREKSSILTK